MQTAFGIFLRSLALYALFTLPAVFYPVLYVLSLMYVITFGWFACVLFMFISVITFNTTSSSFIRKCVLWLAVPVSVAFAFQLIEVFGSQRNVWHSGAFLVFPVAATVSGWVSLLFSFHRMEAPDPDLQKAAATDTSVQDHSIID